MKNSNKCVPLDIVKQNKNDNKGFYDFCIEKEFFTKEISRKDFVDYALAIPGKVPRNQALNEAMVFAYTNMMNYYRSEGIADDLKKISKYSPITEVKDLTTMGEVIMMWGNSKQIYKINKDFMSELTKTTNLKIPMSSLEHLPIDIMYIDFEDSEDLRPIIGAFVYVIPNGGEPQLDIIMVTDDGIFFSYYTTLIYEDGVAEVPEDLIKENTPFAVLATGPDETHLKGKTYENDQRESIVKGILQVLLFMSADNTDITESPVTKKTYKEYTTPKHKFSEVKMWDVGVRYGAAIELSKKQSSSDGVTETVIDGEHHTSSKKRPHIRSAHWQRYRVGKGRTEIRVHWIAPIMVNSDGSDDIDAVIRKVNK